MITAIEIENFKAFGERQRIELRPITLLFGPNSGGKSTIIQALHFAREVMLGRTSDVHRTESGGDLVDLGGFRNILHGHGRHRSTITLRFELDLSERPLDYIPSAQLAEIESLYTEMMATIISRVERAAITLDISGARECTVDEYCVELNGIAFAVLGTSPQQPHSVLMLNWLHPLLLVPNEEVAFRSAATILAEDAWQRIEAGEADSDPMNRIRAYVGELGQVVKYESALLDMFPGLNISDTSGWGAPMFDVVRLPLGLPDWNSALDIHVSPKWKELTQSGREFVEFISTMVIGPGKVLRDSLQQFRYLGPLRDIPPRRLAHADPVGYSRWPRGLAAWERLVDDGSLLEKVGNWLWREESLDTGFQLLARRTRQVDEQLILRMIADQQFIDTDGAVDINRFPGLAEIPSEPSLVLQDVRRGIEVHPFDVGVGLSQVVPVIVAALDWEGRLVAMEQPELHLHPKQQAALGDLLIEGALGQSGRVLIVETHSEHLILRLLRRVRETGKGLTPPNHALQADQLRVLYVGQNGSTTSIVREMTVDLDGNFVQPWPDDFFEQDFKERFS